MDSDATFMKYYPFGAATWHGDQTDRYRFGGKELDRTLGLDLYDFEARMYDPVLARFCQPDPMAWKYTWLSPYAYCANNPIRYIDPSGQILMAYGDTDETYNLEIKDNRLVFMTSDNIAFSGDDPLLEETLLGVNHIAANPFGNAFIKKLIADDNIAYIRPIYNGENRAREQSDGSYLIFWNPFNREGGISEYGTDRPPYIGLSHELGHFDDYISGNNNTNPWCYASDGQVASWSEIHACYIENRIRLENNIPVRTFYIKKDNGGYEPSRVALPPNALRIRLQSPIELPLFYKIYQLIK